LFLFPPPLRLPLLLDAHHLALGSFPLALLPRRLLTPRLGRLQILDPRPVAESEPALDLFGFRFALEPDALLLAEGGAEGVRRGVRVGPVRVVLLEEGSQALRFGQSSSFLGDVFFERRKRVRRRLVIRDRVV
jgi:hypothetical protein